MQFEIFGEKKTRVDVLHSSFICIVGTESNALKLRIHDFLRITRPQANNELIGMDMISSYWRQPKGPLQHCFLVRLHRAPINRPKTFTEMTTMGQHNNNNNNECVDCFNFPSKLFKYIMQGMIKRNQTDTQSHNKRQHI